MSEFNNRIQAQRSALKIINGSGKFSEPLLSLTDKAIDRWSRNNGIKETELLVVLLTKLSKCLFFLANKSQEQMTEDYKDLTQQVDQYLHALKFQTERYL